MDNIDETNPRILQILADLPPAAWPKAERRLAAVARYVAGSERSAAEARRVADSLGIGVSLFYRMARIYVKGREDACKPVDASSRRMEGIIADAVRNGVGGARPAQVMRSVAAACAAEGLPVPSERLVRARCAELMAGREVGSRLGVAADLLIDRAVLGIVADDGMRREAPELTCVVDARSGVILAHEHSVGRPAAPAVEALIGRTAVAESTIGVSVSDEALHLPGPLAAIEASDALYVPGRWRTGAAIRAATGLRLGRVGLLEKPSADPHQKTVRAALVRAVVDELLARPRP